MKRKFSAAHPECRCLATITLKDGSKAQCMRAQKTGSLCIQHDRILATARAALKH